MKTQPLNEDPSESAPRRLANKWYRFQNAHWPRYIFIHINKTAGSSIEHALRLRFEHKTASEKLTELGPTRWNRAFKFSFVRNPWDKVYSHYSYRVTTNQTSLGDQHIDFSDWVLEAYSLRNPTYYDQPKMFLPQTDWISDSFGNCMVDYVGRFENLSDDFRYLCRRLRIDTSLPHLKSSGHSDYRLHYSSAARKAVEDVFAMDLIKFNYSF